MMTRDLFEKYKTKTGKTDMKQKDFSSKLSMRAAIENPKLKNAVYVDWPVFERYWWGLSEWFEGDDFKPEMKTQKANEGKRYVLNNKTTRQRVALTLFGNALGGWTSRLSRRAATPEIVSSNLIPPSIQETDLFKVRQ
jgi:hypothetical protein